MPLLGPAEQGDLDKAETTLKSLLEAVPESAATHEAAGYLALKRSKNLDAEKHYLEALKLDPESVNALNNLGVVYLNLAQTGKGHHYKKKSIEMFERAVKVQPTFKLAQNNIETASKAAKVGAPVGLFFLAWMLLRGLGGITSSVASTSKSSGMGIDQGWSLLSPVTSSYLLTGANIYFIMLFLAALILAMVCFLPRVPKHRAIIEYQFATVTGWLVMFILFSMAAALYITGFWILDSRSTPFSALAFGVSLILVFFSGLNLLRQWRVRRAHS